MVTPDDLDLGLVAQSFRGEIRQWLSENTPAGLIDVDPESATPAQTVELEKWADQLYRAGYMGITWPKEYGGRGLSVVEVSVMNEEFDRARVARMTRGVGEWLVAPAILKWGSESQKKRLLPRILDGSDVYCQGFSEPGAGSDLAALSTVGRVEGDDVVITGQKLWTSGATRANMLFCLCRTDPSAPRHRGITYVLVPMRLADGSSNAMELNPIRQMTGEADFTATFLDGARAPLDNVIGGLNNGWQVTMTTLGSERGGSVTTQHVPFAREFWQAVEIARKTGAAEDSRVRQQLAWAFTQVEIMRYQGLATLGDVLTGKESDARASVNKMFWSEYSQAFLDRVANIRGAEAMLLPAQPSDSYEPDSWTRNMLQSRSSTIWGGTAEVQRNIVAERVLGLPR
ncbi:alkylation response protein AidB-like acyl-CoA dehydrogenase [Rhodococcus sp. 27YEA15]